MLLPLGEVTVERLPERLAGLNRSVMLTGQVVAQEGGSATLRTSAGDVVVRTPQPLPTDRPVSLQIVAPPPAVAGTAAALLRAIALAPAGPTATPAPRVPAPATPPTAAPPAAGPAQPPATARTGPPAAPVPPPTGTPPLLQPGAVVTAVVIASPVRPGQDLRSTATGQGASATSTPTGGTAPLPAPAAPGLGLILPGSAGGQTALPLPAEALTALSAAAGSSPAQAGQAGPGQTAPPPQGTPGASLVTGPTGGPTGPLQPQAPTVPGAPQAGGPGLTPTVRLPTAGLPMAGLPVAGGMTAAGMAAGFPALTALPPLPVVPLPTVPLPPVPPLPTLPVLPPIPEVMPFPTPAGGASPQGGGPLAGTGLPGEGAPGDGVALSRPAPPSAGPALSGPALSGPAAATSLGGPGAPAGMPAPSHSQAAPGPTDPDPGASAAPLDRLTGPPEPEDGGTPGLAAPARPPLTAAPAGPHGAAPEAAGPPRPPAPPPLAGNPPVPIEAEGAAEGAGAPLLPPPRQAASQQLMPGQSLLVRILATDTASIAPPAPAGPLPADAPATVNAPVNADPGARPPGGIVGTLTGSTSGGLAVVTTPHGTLLLQARAGLPAGSELLLSLEAPAARPAPPTRLDPAAGNDWPALREVMETLAASDPTLARAVAAAVLPQPNRRLAANLLFFLSAIRGGDAAGWLGDAAVSALEGSGRGELLHRLTEDFRTLSRQAQEPLPDGWRAWTVPFGEAERPGRLQLYLRQGEDGSAAPGGRGRPGATRFLLEVEFSRFGPMQLDGLVRPRQLDLLVRTRDLLPAAMTRDLNALFRESLELFGYAGSLGFRTGAHGWITIRRGGGPGGTVRA